MNGAFLAKTAVLFKLDPVGIVLFVFGGIVIALLALGAFERNSNVFRFHKDLRKSTVNKTPKIRCSIRLTYPADICQAYYKE